MWMLQLMAWVPYSHRRENTPLKHLLNVTTQSDTQLHTIQPPSHPQNITTTSMRELRQSTDKRGVCNWCTRWQKGGCGRCCTLYTRLQWNGLSMRTYNALELNVIYLYTRLQRNGLHPVSTGMGKVRNELYLSLRTYNALELRLTKWTTGGI